MELNEFLEKIVPILKVGNVEVIASTYNSINNYENEKMYRGSNLRLITYQSGYHSSIFDDERKQVTKGQEKELSEKTLEAISNEKTFKKIIIYYVGFSAFGKAVDSIMEFKEKFPDSIVCAFTCDCELESKKHRLDKLKKSGKIDYYCYSGECGGYNAMSSICDAFLLWE